MSTLLELARSIEPYSLAFQELYRLMTIALEVPVSTATCEHSFLCMKPVKSRVRHRMCDQRLSDVVLLSIESQRTACIDFNKFVDLFDAMLQNRKLLLHGTGICRLSFWNFG